MENQAAGYEEKRRYKRVNVDAEAVCEIFSVDSQSLRLNKYTPKIPAKVENISMGGLQIIADAQVPVEQILRMKVVFNVSGKVIWVYSQARWASFDPKINKYRIGLQFFYLQERHRITCSAIIEGRLN